MYKSHEYITNIHRILKNNKKIKTSTLAQFHIVQIVFNQNLILGDCYSEMSFLQFLVTRGTPEAFERTENGVILCKITPLQLCKDLQIGDKNHQLFQIH